MSGETSWRRTIPEAMRPSQLPGSRRRCFAGRARWPGSARALLAACAILLFVPARPCASQVLPGPAQNVLAGSRIFGARGCVKCHAVRGMGGDIGPDLGRSHGSRSFYEFAAQMWDHLPAMSRRMRELSIERPHLDPWELGDLVAFLFWLDYFDRPGDPETGERLFASKQCIVCHQVGEVGGVVGPSLDFLRQFGTPIEMAAALWNHGPAMTELMREQGVRRPTFSEKELSDLFAYLKSLSATPPEASVYVLPGRVDRGRQWFAEKRCIDCHSIGGQGATVGPDLAEVGRRRSPIEFAARMWNKAPGMLAAMQARRLMVPEISAQDMADVVAYLYSLEYFGRSGDASRGRRLLGNRGCLECHSLAGRGERLAADLARVTTLDSPAAVVAALWNHMLVTVPASARGTITWPRLRADQMADLTAYFQSLASPR